MKYFLLEPRIRSPYELGLLCLSLLWAYLKNEDEVITGLITVCARTRLKAKLAPRMRKKKSQNRSLDWQERDWQLNGLPEEWGQSNHRTDHHMSKNETKSWKAYTSRMRTKPSQNWSSHEQERDWKLNTVPYLKNEDEVVTELITGWPWTRLKT